MKTLEDKHRLMKVREGLVIVLLLLSLQAYSFETVSTYVAPSKPDTTHYDVVTASLNLEALNLQGNMNSYSNKLNHYSAEYILAEEMESNIDLEDWMLSSKNSYWNDVYADKEDAIQLEEWMMDASLW